MFHDRRSVLAALGAALPFAVPRWATAGPAPGLRLRAFEDAVREAFHGPATADGCRRVPVGHSDLVAAGVQGCVNDRPFAGFPAGGLRVVRCGAEPGPAVGGVRLYAAFVDVAVNDGAAGRPLDFAALPPAPVLDAFFSPTARRTTV